MITKFQVVNPIPIRTKPHLNRRGELVIPNIATMYYKWYVVVARDNTITGDREYFILFGHEKFDENCVRLYKDYSRQYAIKLQYGEFSDFINKEIATRGNVDIAYLYSEGLDYDVWTVR